MFCFFFPFRSLRQSAIRTMATTPPHSAGLLFPPFAESFRRLHAVHAEFKRTLARLLAHTHSKKAHVHAGAHALGIKHTSTIVLLCSVTMVSVRFNA